MNLPEILLWLNGHRGKIIGVILGLVFGWFAICYGVFKAIFVTICIVIGYHFGKLLDQKVNLKDWFSRFFKT